MIWYDDHSPLSEYSCVVVDAVHFAVFFLEENKNDNDDNNTTALLFLLPEKIHFDYCPNRKISY